MSERIQLSRDDLYSTQVDEIINEQRLRNQTGIKVETPSLWRRVILNSLFFLSVAGSIGGAFGWILIEPYMNESVVVGGTISYVDTLMVGDTQTFQVGVRDQVIYLTDEVTSVVGRDSYSDVVKPGDLEGGMPVVVTAMPLEEEGETTMFATEVEVGGHSDEVLNEPIPDLAEHAKTALIGGLFCFATIGACIAGCIAAADAMVSRNLTRGLYCALAGIGIAGVGGFVALIPSGMIFHVTTVLVSLVHGGLWTTGTIGGIGLIVMVVGRSLTWGVLGLCVGLGQGVALRSRQLIVNGLLGGALGGLVGGAFFDPVDQMFTSMGLTGEAIASRGVGFTIIGLSTGLMIGLVEHFSKDAWLLMRGGPLAGKEFIIHKSPTVLGSSPKCDIYIFKDPEVDPKHAQIRKVGNRHEIVDLGSRSGVSVNGQAVSRMTLQAGDLIVIGETVLEYSGRSSGSGGIS